MMTARDEEQRAAMKNIMARLYAINSYYAHQDFKSANPEGRRYDKKGAPLPYRRYTLSPLTREAREYYVMSQNVIWSDETEGKIKGYVMRLRLSGDLDKILDWEKSQPGRYKNNPWRQE